MQYTAWALLFLITVWQLFRVFGGPVTEAENPWVLLGRSALFAFLIGYAKPIFLLTLKIATAPYTALMDIQMTAEDFTFAGIEQALQNGLTSLIATISVVGLLLLTILEIALGWNYFKLLLETVERYIVVGVLCYTSPLAFSGRIQSNNAGIPVVVPDGRVAAIAPCDECLVPAWLFNLGRPVHRHRRRLVQRKRQCVPVAILCSCFLKDSTEI